MLFQRCVRAGIMWINTGNTTITKYSWLSLSRTRLSRITAYPEMKIWSLLKHENLTTGKNIVEKRRNCSCSSFPQYFQYISVTSRVQLHIYLSNVVVRIIFSSILQIWYVEVRISRSISESPFEFEITRVDCRCTAFPRHQNMKKFVVPHSVTNDKPKVASENINAWIKKKSNRRTLFRPRR